MATNDVEIRVGSQDNTSADFDALKARLNELRDKVVAATVDVNDKNAQHELDLINAKLEATSKKVASPRLDVAGAAQAQAVISGLDLQLDKLAEKDVSAKADVNTGDADAKIDHVDEKLDELGHKSVSPKVSLDTSQAQSALSALLSSLTGMPAIIAGVMAVLPAIPGALAGMGAAAGTTALAFGPVIKALQDSATVAASSAKSSGQNSTQLAQTELANSIAIVGAQRAISDARTQAAHDAITSDQAIAEAEQSVRDAQTQAAHDAVTSAESVAQAEESLKTAEATEQQAQESLTQARQQAILTLQSLNDAQKDSALGAQQAQLNLQQAELNQQQVDKSSTSTALQKAQAALSVKEAQQALKEAQEQATNSTKAANQANKEGITGSPVYVQAKKAQQQAVQGVTNAQRALMDAQRQATWTQQQDAEAIKNAQAGVAKAEQQAAWTQQKDAEAIQTAVQNLSNTYKQQGLAAKAAAFAGIQPISQYTKDMAGLTAAGRDVVHQLLDLKQNMSGLSQIAQKAVLPGFSVFLDGVNKTLPTVNKEVGDMGKILGDAFTGAGHALESSGVQQELRAVLDEGNQFMRILIPAVGGLAEAFLKMGAQSGPAVTGVAKAMAGILKVVGDVLNLATPGLSHLMAGIGDGIAKWADSFDKWSRSKQAREDVNKFFAYLHDNGSTIMSIVKDLAKYIPDLLSGASAAGTAELNALSMFLGWVAKLPPSFAKPVMELAGALILLSKTGVLKVGIQLAGAAKNLITGSTLTVAGDAAAEAMGTAIRVSGGEVAAEFRAAIAEGGGAGGAASGAEGAGGGAAGGAVTKGGILGGLGAVASGLSLIISGAVVGGIIKGFGDSLAPAGTEAGKLNKVLQSKFDIAGFNIFSGYIAKSLPAMGTFISNVGSEIKRLPGQFAAVMSSIEGDIVHSAARWFDDARKAILDFGNYGATQFDKIRHNIASRWDGMFDDAKKFWGTQFPAAVHGAINDVISWVQGKLDNLRHDIASKWDGLLSDAKKFWTNQLSDAIHGAINNVISWVQGKLDSLRHDIASKWDGIKSDAKSDWNTVYNNIIGPIKTAFNWVTGKLDDLRHAMASKWDSIQGDASRGWGGLKKIMGSPINFVIKDVYMGGIRRLWDDVMNALGLGSLDLPSVSPIAFAGGGRLPGFGGGDRNLALLEDGEAVVDKHRTRQFAPVLSAMGVPGFAKGGLVGDAIDMGKMLIAAKTDNQTAFSNAFKDFIPGGNGGAAGHWASAVAKLPAEMAVDMVKGLWKKITGAAASSGGGGYAGKGGGGVPGNVASYKNDILAVLKALGQSAGDLGIVESQMETESGGNPTIVNKWDSNWQEGHPSVGLMQVIRGTFDAYAGRYRNVGPFEYGVSVNPMANIYAGLNYAVHTYGKNWVNVLGHGHGYAAGGAVGGGWAMVGEHGRELVKVPGGSTVFPHGATNQMVAGASGGGLVQLVVSAEGQSEFEQFMLTAIRKWVRVKGGVGPNSVQAAFGRV